jgi:hypothetical protein
MNEPVGGVRSRDHLRSSQRDPEPKIRESRRRNLIGVIAAVAMAALAVGGVAFFLTAGDDGPPVSAPTTTSPAAAGPLVLTWTQHQLDGRITYPARWEDGYVALLDGELAVSPDGAADWTVLANQPPMLSGSSAGDWSAIALVVVGDDLLVIDARDGAPIAAQRSDDGSAWRDVPFDGATGRGADESLVSVLASEEIGLVAVHDSFLNPGWTRNAWVLSGDAFVRAPYLFAVAALPLPSWSADVRPAPVNVVPPAGVAVVAERGGRYTGFDGETGTDVGAGVEAGRAMAYTSVDGRSWDPIAPVAADVVEECNELEWRRTVTPDLVETGPLGWFAAGSDGCVSGVMWHSENGLDWHRIAELDQIHAWVFQAAFPAPYPPVFLVEEERVVVYAAQQYPRRSLWNAWVGVAPTREAVPSDGAWGRYGEWTDRLDAVVEDRLLFVEAFDSTYEGLVNCTDAHARASSSREDFRDRTDQIAATEGISPQDAYDRSVGAFLASLEWLTRHGCEGAEDFVSVG